MRNNGKVVSKDSLMRQLYPDAELRESHTIDVLMGRLRKKIGHLPILMPSSLSADRATVSTPGNNRHGLSH